MSGASEVRLNLDGLKGLKKLFQDASKVSVDVGIFKQNDARTDPLGVADSTSNVEIGFKHEFGVGSEGVPQRSFLWVPLSGRLAKVIEENRAGLEDTLVSEGPAAVANDLGLMGEGIVDEAFDTGGWGSWAPNSPKTVAIKGHGQPLIDTTQLRESVSSRVVKKGRS